MALILSGDSTYAEQADVDSLSPQLATAWVSFDSAGTILDSYNVGGVVRDSVGRFSITFSTPMDNTGYSAVVSSTMSSYTTQNDSVGIDVILASSVSVWSQRADGAEIDLPYYSLQVFGGKA